MWIVYNKFDPNHNVTCRDKEEAVALGIRIQHENSNNLYCVESVPVNEYDTWLLLKTLSAPDRRTDFSEDRYVDLIR